MQPRIQCWDRPGRFAAWRVHEVHAPIAVLVLTYILGLMYLIQREFIVGVIQCVIDRDSRRHPPETLAWHAASEGADETTLTAI